MGGIKVASWVNGILLFIHGLDPLARAKIQSRTNKLARDIAWEFALQFISKPFARAPLVVTIEAQFNMSEKYKFHNNHGVYIVTSTIVHWIDLFTRQPYNELIVDSLNRQINNKGLRVHAWVIMPSHFHTIISCDGKSGFSELMNVFKRTTSQKIIEQIHSTKNESRKEWLLRAFNGEAKRLKRVKHYKVWQDGNHPIELDKPSILEQKFDYIHNNPVEAGYVAKPEDWVNSSATDYFTPKRGLVRIGKIQID